jgi:serine/threonine-protein kinase
VPWDLDRAEAGDDVESLGPTLPYRIVRTLGEGSHGVVLLVEHQRLGKPFVVKLIQAKFSANREVVGRFEREARTLAKLAHEAFVPIVDLGETADGRTYFVMEYFEGRTLQQVLAERGALPIETAVDLARQLLGGLAVAHDAGIVHRDIKPANLFVTSAGRVKILDFGIAKAIQETGTGAFTAQGIAIGTPKYMAPEQARGEAIGFATDVYAVGCVLFELLTGRPLFDGPDARELLRSHIYVDAPSLESRTGWRYPPALEIAVARALRKDPRERFPTARDMASALEAAVVELRVLSGAATSESVPPPAQDPTRPVPANALVVGAATTDRVPASQTAQTERLVDGTAEGTSRTSSEGTSSDGKALAPKAPRRGGAVAIALGLLLLAGAGGALSILLPRLSSGDRGATASTSPDRALESAVPSPSPIARAVESLVAPETPPNPSPSSSASAVASASASPSASSSPSASTSPTGRVASRPRGSSHLQAARAAMQSGDLDQADSEVRQAIASGGGVAAQLLLGEILERRGKTAAARDVYRRILESNPSTAAAVAGLKRCGG